MNQQDLETTAKQMVAPGKGLLAADESEKTCKKRFDSVGVECTEETRREYRELLLTTPDAKQFMSGVIFFDETLRQSTSDGKTFVQYLQSQDILPGIKVDKGLIDLPGFEGEKVSQGLDGLPERMAEYAGLGAKFAKWRSVITIGDGIPTDTCIEANAYVLARYARICQDANIVPMVEPEVLFDGNHTIEQCEEVVSKTYDALFKFMKQYRVHMPGAILKTSMVLPGKDSGTEINHDDVAERTVRALHDHVPHDLGGVVFLSGGQTSSDAFIRLNRIAKKGPHPWGVTFSYSRALQDPVLKAWAKDRNAKEATQKLFYQQLKFASDANKGELDEAQLSEDNFVTKSQDL
ncbi:MAG TPA: class I fructose-bisphosphate aldolase [Candidatus Saccharimonadales bacterium]|nr:class I fructose-bisphosphate aldolase [Candidatus Saccharimonadales bacterium]